MTYLFYFLVLWLIIGVSYNAVMEETYNTNPAWWEIALVIPFIVVSWIGYFIVILYKKWSQ